MKIINKNNQKGFTIVEVVITIVVLPIIVVAITNAFMSLGHSYQITRQLNEMYAVLSACPEIDRALQYDVVTSATNCYPNNTFSSENGGTTSFNYTPQLNVSTAVSLPNTDPLYNIQDSKVIDVNVGFIDSSGKPLKMRLLISRNGISQQ
jgi:prepilin-type N-terminal cleavage/methylation domain-containing protein